VASFETLFQSGYADRRDLEVPLYSSKARAQFIMTITGYRFKGRAFSFDRDRFPKSPITRLREGLSESMFLTGS
jgi:hypothetical protein